MNYLIMVREVRGQAASLPLPSKAKVVMVKISCKHCMAVDSKMTLKLKFDQIVSVVDSKKLKMALKPADSGMLMVV